MLRFDHRWLTASLSTLLALCIYLVWFLSQKKCLVRAAVKHLLLGINGQCKIDDQADLQLSKHSRVGIFGFWLVFEATSDSIPSMFIFKDSLSVKDCARLARTVKYLQLQR